MYQVQISERLEAYWEAWFDNCRITHATDGTTIIEPRGADQAALYGVISQLRDLGLTLLSVQRVAPAKARG